LKEKLREDFENLSDEQLEQATEDFDLYYISYEVFLFYFRNCCTTIMTREMELRPNLFTFQNNLKDPQTHGVYIWENK